MSFVVLGRMRHNVSNKVGDGGESRKGGVGETSNDWNVARDGVVGERKVSGVDGSTI